MKIDFNPFSHTADHENIHDRMKSGHRWPPFLSWPWPWFRDLLVKLYQHFGILVLFSIFLVIGGLFTLVGFFFFNNNWSVPFILNPHSEKVFTMRRQAIQTLGEIQALKNKKLSLQERITLLQDQLRQNERFQAELRNYFLQEREDKRQALTVIEQLAQRYRHNLKVFLKSPQMDSTQFQQQLKRIDGEFQQKLLSKEQYWRHRAELWEGQNTSLDAELKMHDLNERIGQIQKDKATLDRILGDGVLEVGGENLPQSFPLLNMKREFEKISEENHKLSLEIQDLKNELGDHQNTLSHLMKLWVVLRESPYVRAFDRNIVMAFVPYENLDHVEVNDPVYSCSFKVFWCHEIGTVKGIQKGEVVESHPFFKRELRGRIIEMGLHEVKLGENDLLHIGRPPFLLIF